MKKNWILILSVLAFLAVAIVILVSSGVFSADKCSECNSEPAETTEAPTDKAETAVQEYKGQVDLTSVPDKVTVIDFSATWCGPCRMFAPVLESVAKKYGDEARFYSVDVDRNEALAAAYEVTSIPKVVVLYPDGTRREQTGYMDAPELESLLQK